MWVIFRGGPVANREGIFPRCFHLLQTQHDLRRQPKRVVCRLVALGF